MLIYWKGGEYMKRPIEDRVSVIRSLNSGEINVASAMEILSCSRRTIERYRNSLLLHGEMGLKDNRHSNYHKLTQGRAKGNQKL